VTELLQLHRAEERNDAEIKKKIHATAKFLPEPVKATEFIRKLSQQMLTDSNLLPLMERVVEPDVSCAECMQAVVSKGRINYQLPAAINVL
jgi:sister-chromatid-cohesion protein PDS5